MDVPDIRCPKCGILVTTERTLDPRYLIGHCRKHEVVHVRADDLLPAGQTDPRHHDLGKPLPAERD